MLRDALGEELSTALTTTARFWKMVDRLDDEEEVMLHTWRHTPRSVRVAWRGLLRSVALRATAYCTPPAHDRPSVCTVDRRVADIDVHTLEMHT